MFSELLYNSMNTDFYIKVFKSSSEFLKWMIKNIQYILNVFRPIGIILAVNNYYRNNKTQEIAAIELRKLFIYN